MDTIDTARIFIKCLSTNILYVIFVNNVQIELDSAWINRRVFEHWKKIGPLGVHQRIWDEWLENDVEETIEIVCYFSHNDDYN